MSTLNVVGFEIIETSIKWFPVPAFLCACANLQKRPQRVKKRIGYRIFLVIGDEVSPITKTAFDEFYFRRQAVLQGCAGKTVDIATVVCRLEDAKPREIVRIYCQRFKVKSDGSIDEHHSKPCQPAATRTDSAVQRDDRKQRDVLVETDERLQARRLVQTLTMISSVAQRKILDVLRR